MPRTLSLLNSGYPAGRRLVRILVFGQSISRQNWWKILAEELSESFPKASVEVTNTAIAGFSASQLVRTLPHCVYPYYPDLVVFHDYGGKQTGEWERMIHEIRRRTAAEILVWTDHRGHGGEPGSKEEAARRVRGDTESDAIRYIAAKYGCEVADIRAKWNEHLAETDMPPKALLTDNVHLNDEGNALLASLLLPYFRASSVDSAGWMGTVRSYEAKRAADFGADDEIRFDGRPWRKLGTQAVGLTPEDRLILDFEGSRVDLIPGLLDDDVVSGLKTLAAGVPTREGGPRPDDAAVAGTAKPTGVRPDPDDPAAADTTRPTGVSSGPAAEHPESTAGRPRRGDAANPAGTARVLIDGRPPSEYPELYTYSIPTRAHGADWQPAIRRVMFRERPLEEEWTMRIHDISPDATAFRFDVEGSITGPDGGGIFDGTNYAFGRFGDILDYTGSDDYPDVFVSPSGRVVVDHRDFKITWAQQYSGEPCPEGFEIRWNTVSMHIDVYRPVPGVDDVIRPITVAAGLAPGAHRLELIPNGDGPVPLHSVEIHRPPLWGAP